MFILAQPLTLSIQSHAILFDLPVLPKGTVSLSLAQVAACLLPEVTSHIEDCNQFHFTEFAPQLEWGNAGFFGLKVSAQNFSQAVSLTSRLREVFPSTPIVWGGEFATLLPDECSKYADVVISGLFEGVVNEFKRDFLEGTFQKKYKSNGVLPFLTYQATATKLFESYSNFHEFMGWPFESSRGCTESCSFCMVHTMQHSSYHTKSLPQMMAELKNYKGKFVNVVDYNIGVERTHVLQLSEAMRQSGVNGWMGEMCIEMLDDNEVLTALEESGCRMIYCGLEAIDQKDLNSVHKMNTNHVENYERIIRKAQSHGVQIAAGIILGLEGNTLQGMERIREFFQRMGLVYAKLTFLTYNPGARVQYYMRKKGTFLTDDYSAYDGQHLSFMQHGMNAEDVYSSAKKFIQNFYSIPKIIARSFNTKLSWQRRVEFILFNLCYRQIYCQWTANNFYRTEGSFDRELTLAYRKSAVQKLAEYFLFHLRKH